MVGIEQTNRLFAPERMRKINRLIGLFVAGLVLAPLPSAQADSTALVYPMNPIRRGEDTGESLRRRAQDGHRRSRAQLEGAKKPTLDELKRREKTKIVHLVYPPSCGSRNADRFREELLALQNPNDSFNVEVWGNERVFYVNDRIEYFIRSNRTAYVSLFWVGPEGSVFIPFGNLHVEANRDHRINPRNIIVEPVGLERWRVLATLEPHHFPCRGGSGAFSQALARLRSGGPWAIGQWDVLSKVKRRKKRKRRKRPRH